MKTDLELKKFYNVEFGKMYKIINSRGQDFYDLVDKTFHLERRLNEKHGGIRCITDDYRWDISVLDDYDYIEIGSFPLLTSAEKVYLSYIIAPFKDRVIGIMKFSNIAGISEAIAIDVEVDRALKSYYSTEPIYLPYFKAGTMYKNLIAGKRYTPKELGL